MVLMIDNYDSFTYNLVQYLGELGAEVQTHRNDQVTVQQVAALEPSHVVLSPGPCTPDQAGICLELIRTLAGRIPILGVCLGHQSIGQAFGGKVVRAREVMHGKTSRIHHAKPVQNTARFTSRNDALPSMSGSAAKGTKNAAASGLYRNTSNPFRVSYRSSAFSQCCPALAYTM